MCRLCEEKVYNNNRLLKFSRVSLILIDENREIVTALQKSLSLT